jgi:thiamine biosynthesis lipoprotein ApbE
MDPRDGMAEPTVRQATVVATSGLWADALSTAAAVSGHRPRGATRWWLVR